MDKFERLLTYADIFSEESHDSFDLFRQFSTKNILVKLAHINAILFNDHIDSDERIFNEVLFGSNNIPTSLKSAIVQKSRDGSFFASPSISILIKHALINFREDQDDSILYVDFAIELFKTILIFNRTFLDGLKVGGTLNSFKSQFTLDAMQQTYIRPHRFTNYLLKSAFMCNFLSQDEILKPFVIKFCQVYGMADPWKISKFLISLLEDNAMKKAKFVLDKKSIPSNLLDDWIIDINRKVGNELTLNFDIIPKPLFPTGGDEVIILDLAFFQYMVDQGFFFNIYKKTITNSDSSLSKFCNYKAYIGKAYFEQYLCRTMLHKIFFRQEQIVISNDKYEDFIVKSNTNNLLVIEAKMSDINARTIENLDFEKFKKTIDDNLLSKKDKDKKNRGAYQIINQIKQLIEPNNTVELKEIFKIKNTKNLNIYPILITSDTNYSLLGTNKYVIGKTMDEINEVGKHFNSINPIIIVNINVLIEYFPYLCQDKFNFTELIKGYLKEIRKWEKAVLRDANDFYSYHMSSQSFDEYLRNKLKGNTIVEKFEIFEQSFGEELSKIDFS